MKYGSFHFLSILQEPAPPCPELDLTFSEAFSKCIASSPHKEPPYVCNANYFMKRYNSGNTSLHFVPHKVV